jgi:hypothetical protein
MDKKKVKIGSPTMRKKKNRETKKRRASKKILRKAMKKQKKKRNGMRMPINSKRGKMRFQFKKDTTNAKSKKKNRVSCFLVCLR